MAKQTKETLFDAGSDKSAQGPVECLGMKFPNDEARRAHFTELLRKKLKDPSFRKIEGFPKGDDEDILALSDPPYYTACPNPFVKECLSTWSGRSDASADRNTEPFVTDVSEGKKHALYSAHSYHTKVPHQAIMRYLQHYTMPGDVILDFFAGSGQTGLAATMLQFESDSKGRQVYPILSELSPAATQIAYHYLSRLPSDFSEAAESLISSVKTSWGWLYETKQPTGKEASYYVWADVFLCPDCSGEFDFHSAAVDDDESKISKSFPCPLCGSEVTKRSLKKSMTSLFDPYLHKTIQYPKYELVLVSTEGGKDATEFKPAAHDLQIIQRVASTKPAFWVPTEEFPKHDRFKRDALAAKGVSHAHHFYMPRNLLALGALHDAIMQHEYRLPLLHAFTGILLGVSRLQRYRPKSGFPNMVMSGTLYIGSLVREWNVFQWYLGKVRSLCTADRAKQSLHSKSYAITTQSSTALNLPESSIDYIFVDPPFGGNLQYSELNFMYESWLKVKTTATHEGVINAPQGKGVEEYGDLMKRCFVEAHKALKPGRWMTVEFHNSKASIWNMIHESIAMAGFVIADVRVLDKQQNTFKQINNPGAVEKDLVITAYKPTEAFESDFRTKAGSEPGAWEFVRSHLRHLPIFSEKDGSAEVLAERQKYLLFDRMVAFHVQRGLPVPLSASEFYLGLTQKFAERDGMYFLSDQVSQYEMQRLQTGEIEQMTLFVSDEKSAIQWVRLQLQTPMTYQELSPLYMQEALRVWEKHERPIELQTILDENFVLSSNGQWRVPDPKKEADLEQLRSRSLLKEFQQNLDTKGKLKVVRTEALRAGFKEAWQKKDYTTIVQMAKRVPEAVIQEDQALLMYFDNASLMLGE